VFLGNWRKFVCGAMVFVFPVSILATDSGAAMLYAKGGVLLNRNTAPAAAAIFPDDLVETQSDHVANITADGSSVTVQPESAVQFEGTEIFLDHGSVSVMTKGAMRVRVNCITVVPVYAEWTQYDVTDQNGTVIIESHKKDVEIREAHHRDEDPRPNPSKHAERADAVAIVHEGEQRKRDDSCPAGARPGAPIHANGAILDSLLAKSVGAGAIGVLVIWVLWHSNEPVSPSMPQP
jgi:hypothetical protein